jgi:hypothetical protein
VILSNCHGHGLSKGNIIKIFYHGLDESTQEVLNVVAGGIFCTKLQINLINYSKTKSYSNTIGPNIKPLSAKLLLSPMKAVVFLILTKLWHEWMPWPSKWMLSIKK